MAVAALVFFPTAALCAQQAARDAARRSDQLAQDYFHPRLVMAYQREIGLTDEQQDQIVAEFQNAQSQFIELQWELESRMRNMRELASHDRVDEAAALAELEQILDFERQIKRSQMIMFVRIKNALTPEQQVQLREYRANPRRR